MIALLDPGLFVAAMAVFGLMIGSFLNVVVHRLPLMMDREWRGDCHALLGSTAPETPALSLARPRSRCPRCRRAIGAFENIPVLSYLALRGKCRHCGAGIYVTRWWNCWLACAAVTQPAFCRRQSHPRRRAHAPMAFAAASYLWALPWRSP